MLKVSTCYGLRLDQRNSTGSAPPSSWVGTGLAYEPVGGHGSSTVARGNGRMHRPVGRRATSPDKVLARLFNPASILPHTGQTTIWSLYPLSISPLALTNIHDPRASPKQGFVTVYGWTDVTPPEVLYNLARLGQGSFTDQLEDMEAAQLPRITEECTV
ncbi:uncharacterized protein BDR25DRAFT_359422 [Lindgomyces ingoldianus]|uniref:Uncharacterized protein n=1 Tax=Lindgomyces ingoldianus TaxID=673940 RepID=A0ACB6QI17_9PLEO|nr:uncharacterized protein BDR25DRAFT_359422 [Lindgomyces ingoldianus]KAF2466530.1 hypothetical protein BDR25DRAFT_359422 [Lindgomyces ingoldianus]